MGQYNRLENEDRALLCKYFKGPKMSGDAIAIKVGCTRATVYKLKTMWEQGYLLEDGTYKHDTFSKSLAKLNEAGYANRQNKLQPSIAEQARKEYHEVYEKLSRTKFNARHLSKSVTISFRDYMILNGYTVVKPNHYIKIDSTS